MDTISHGLPGGEGSHSISPLFPNNWNGEGEETESGQAGGLGRTRLAIGSEEDQIGVQEGSDGAAPTPL